MYFIKDDGNKKIINKYVNIFFINFNLCFTLKDQVKKQKYLKSYLLFNKQDRKSFFF